MAPIRTGLGLAATQLLLLLEEAATDTGGGSASCAAHSGVERCVEDEDEVSQLQHTARPHGRGFGHINFKEKACDPECQNGGTCLLGVVCRCAAGWKGKDCTTPTELSQEPHSGEPECSEDFEVFPYIQPSLWGFYTGWQMCGEGKRQSPIDIPRRAQQENAKAPLALKFDPIPKPVILNNGHNAEVEGAFLNLTLGDITYTAKQFHFHTPSEHRVAGRQFAMEMHIVTVDAAGNAAVIGVLFRLGKANKCLREFRKIPDGGCEDRVNMTVDLECFEEQLSGPWWSYDGSLTTPPCTQDVKWQVMQRRATLSLAQLLIFRSRFKMNARPPQPLNARNVLLNRPRR